MLGDQAGPRGDRALPEAKVAYVPGATFFANEQQPNHARVNYSGVSDERTSASNWFAQDLQAYSYSGMAGSPLDVLN